METELRWLLVVPPFANFPSPLGQTLSQKLYKPLLLKMLKGGTQKDNPVLVCWDQTLADRGDLRFVGAQYNRDGETLDGHFGKRDCERLRPETREPGELDGYPAPKSL